MRTAKRPGDVVPGLLLCRLGQFPLRLRKQPHRFQPRVHVVDRHGDDQFVRLGQIQEIGDATAGFQDFAGDRQFVGGGADVPERVMQDEVFEMHEFTIDPERGVRLEEMRALEKALADRRTGDALVETGERDPYCGFYFEVSNWKSSLGC